MDDDLHTNMDDDLHTNMDDDVHMFDTALNDFENGQVVLDKKLSGALESLNANFIALEALSSEGRRQASDAKNLFNLKQELRPHLSPEQALAYDIRLNGIRRRIERLKQVEPRRGTVCWRFFLGEGANTKICPRLDLQLYLRLFHFVSALFPLISINDKVWKRSDLFAMKNAYNTYKSNMNLVFLLFPLIELFICANRFVMILHQLWLLYYYVSLSLRESLLLCNGSRIESWWIIHHYIASAICIVNLTWPDGPGYRFFIQHFATLMIWQAIIMMLQAQYQNRRHYYDIQGFLRTSLGKAGELDIASPETLVEKPADLTMLVPLLYITYALQLFTGVTLLVKSRQWNEGFWNMLFIGLLIILLGIGNSIATMRVLSKKRTERHHLSIERKKSS